jgi:ribonuclease P protein component
MKGKNTLGKDERVRKQFVLDKLFERSCPYLFAHGFRFTWLILNEPSPAPCQVLFVASKRKLKKAVDRNLRKRLLKELYRLNKHSLHQYLVETQTYLALSINYVGKDVLEFKRFEPKFQAAIQQLILELKKNPHRPLPTAD